MQFLSKLQLPKFAEIEKFMWNCKDSQVAKIILRKKNKSGGHTISNFKTDYSTTEIKTVWQWHKDGHINQWNRVKSLKYIHKPMVI